jgi:hypothetical protein
MEAGCYGRLESVIPPITVPAWMCMSTSQDPGSLGVYGFRNRTDRSYAGLGFVNQGEVEGAGLLDIAPTPLELGGYDVPPSMQGRSLLAGHAGGSAAGPPFSHDAGEVIRDRLSGLGYI